MRQFSIKKLEQFSGVKAHTIRIWEKRYGLFNPQRNGQIRSYNLDDVRKIMNISILVNHGFRISVISSITQPAIEEKISNLHSNNAIYTAIIRDMIGFAYSGDIVSFENILNLTVQKININNSIKHIIIPFLEKIELLSYNDTTSEAHFIVSALRRKLILGIEMIQPMEKKLENVLLFLPEYEHYDLILLYVNYLIKESGKNVYYLGTNISADNFEIVLKSKKLHKIYTYLTDNYKTDIKRYVRIVENTVPDIEFCILTEVAPAASLKGINSISYKDLE